MSDVTPGKETSEWTGLKYGGLICAALEAGLGVVMASDAVPPDSLAAVILGGVMAVLTAVAGGLGVSYIKGRSLVKAAAIKAGSENPTK